MLRTTLRSLTLTLVGLLAIPVLVILVLLLGGLVLLLIMAGPGLFVPVLAAVVFWAVATGKVKMFGDPERSRDTGPSRRA